MTTANTGTPMPAPADMLLIHGAWQGSWAWDALLPELAARGIRAHAADLPGNGCNDADTTPLDAVSLDGATAYLAAWLDAQPHPVAVVGHSGGALAASQLAQARPDKVRCLIYVAGIMLPDGVSYGECVQALAAEHPEVSGIGPFLQWSADRHVSSVPVQAALEIFLHDCPPDAAARAAARLTPQAEGGRAAVPRLTAQRYGRVPRIYIEALRDRSIVPAMQRYLQSLQPGTQRLTIDTGHVPQLARPAELAELLASALQR